MTDTSSALPSTSGENRLLSRTPLGRIADPDEIASSRLPRLEGRGAI